MGVVMNTQPKDFNKDIISIFNKLQNKEKFAFSKYADGEFVILLNKRITNCDNWTFDPNINQKQYEELISSYHFNEDGYYVGISCPCCQPIDHIQWMRNNVGVPPERLTWANIFVNSNYKFFVDNFIPEFKNHDVILVASENGNISNLSFDVEEHIKITNYAFVDNFNLLEILPKKDYKDKLFLFCAGPLGNMLAAKMWKENKKNIYLDIGSTLNKLLLGGDGNRGYLRNHSTIGKTCIW